MDRTCGMRRRSALLGAGLAAAQARRRVGMQDPLTPALSRREREQEKGRGALFRRTMAWPSVGHGHCFRLG